MSTWDVLLVTRANRETDYTELKRKQRDGEALDENEALRARYYQNVTAPTFWRDTGIGPARVKAWNMLLDDDELANADARLDAGNTDILWCGNKQGIPKGVSVTVDPDTGIETVRGTPDYPGDEVLGRRGITRRLLAVAVSPDIGDPPARPLTPQDAHRYLGWAARRWDLI